MKSKLTILIIVLLTLWFTSGCVLARPILNYTGLSVETVDISKAILKSKNSNVYTPESRKYCEMIKWAIKSI